MQQIICKHTMQSSVSSLMTSYSSTTMYLIAVCVTVRVELGKIQYTFIKEMRSEISPCFNYVLCLCLYLALWVWCVCVGGGKWHLGHLHCNLSSLMTDKGINLPFSQELSHLYSTCFYNLNRWPMIFL